MAFVLCLLVLQQADAAEPWADQRLNVTEDLRLWLDAAAQKAAADAGQMAAAPVDGEGLATFHDASGSALHLAQPAEEFQPLLRTLKNFALVRFDGRDDRLLAALGRLELTDFSLFVFAAPASNFGGFRSLLSRRPTTTRPV